MVQTNRGTLLVTLAAAAASANAQLAANAGDPFAVIAKATSVDDLAQSTYLIDAYGLGKVIHDLHADGLDDRDFFNWLATGPFAQVAVSDLNQNGTIDCHEIVDTLARGLAVYAGDADADGLVSIKDLASAMSSIGTVSIATQLQPGDIDASGRVDANDIALVGTVHHRTFAASHFDVADRLVAISSGSCGGGGGGSSSASIYTPPKHSIGVSETYPGHILGYSKPSVIPNDHDFGISTTWPISSHNAFWSHTFPPNHYGFISNQWTRPDGPHAYHVSVSNPPHSRQTSKYWPPTHTITVSEGWYPDTAPPLERHAIQASRTWPPNHTAENSGSIGEHDQVWSIHVPRSDHLADFSGTWDHDQQRSGIAWPPNHIKSPSSSWPDGHRANTSVYWPPSHMTLASGEWPDGTDTNWPPNHMPEFSESWPAPTPGIPLFPPDHTIWTTADQIIDNLPDLPGTGGQGAQ